MRCLSSIDGADARDFDDAVYAEPEADPANAGGWHLVVAIADVTHVRPARRWMEASGAPTRCTSRTGCCRCCRRRSNGLCSLRPGEDRACLAVHLWYDRRGRKLRHRFERALMRSRARLTYERVQAAADGAPTRGASARQRDPAAVRRVCGAGQGAAPARHLDLDLPEAEVRLGPDGRPQAIVTRPRLDAHRLIEEFMIAANVAAAETLDQAGMHCMYRIHDAPDPVKLEALAQLLQSLGMGRGRARSRVRLTCRACSSSSRSTSCRRWSASWCCAPEPGGLRARNIGHFGLNLGRYAHFTSPIRRYADLVVHRALISALRLGEDGLEESVTLDELQTLGGHLSRTERAGWKPSATRSAASRLLLAERIGSTFAGAITGVQKFGVFVRLDELMAEGLVPARTLDEPFTYDPARQALIARFTGTALALGSRVEVELTEVDVLTGQLTFRLVEHTPGAAARRRRRPGRRSDKVQLKRCASWPARHRPPDGRARASPPAGPSAPASA